MVSASLRKSSTNTSVIPTNFPRGDVRAPKEPDVIRILCEALALERKAGHPSMLSRWGQWNEERQAYDQIVCHTKDDS